jgi:hypothetical protein
MRTLFICESIEMGQAEALECGAMPGRKGGIVLKGGRLELPIQSAILLLRRS